MFCCPIRCYVISNYNFCCANYFPVSIFCQAEENNRDGEGDEDEWEDASDSEDADEAVSDSDHDSKGDEKKEKGKEKPTQSKDSSTASSSPCSGQTSTGSPKEQRTPRPKVHIPSPAPVQESPEGGKPLSPFSPLDSHQPVSDWGEEMEMQSPRSSMGGESPLKPPSVEASPSQKKDKEEEHEKESQTSSTDEPVPKGENTGMTLTKVLGSVRTLWFLCGHVHTVFKLLRSATNLFVL